SQFGRLHGNAREEIAVVVDGDAGATVLAVGGAGNGAAGKEVQDPHAVADAEHRHAEIDDRAIGERRALGVHARRTPGEDDALGRELANPRQRKVERMDLAVDALLADAAGDELRVLAAEIEDQDHAPPLSRTGVSFQSIVRRLFGDDDVVDVALPHAGGGDAEEARLRAEGPQGAAPAIAHPRLQPTDELMDIERQTSLVRHPTLDAFGDELDVGLVRLEIAIAAPFLHGLDRSHPAVELVGAALEEDRLAGALF